jgi:hypothetical protein
MNHALRTEKQPPAQPQPATETALLTAEPEQRKQATKLMRRASNVRGPERSAGFDLYCFRLRFGTFGALGGAPYLRQLIGSHSRYANLGVIRTNGDFLASVRAPAGPANRADCQFFRRVLATRAFEIGNFPVGPTNGKPTVNFGYPVFDQSGQVVQAVVFSLAANFIRLAPGCLTDGLQTNGEG